MTDDIKPQDTPEAAPAATAVADAPDSPEGAEGGEKKKKLTQHVELKDVGPCRKHIKVAISRADIDDRMNDHYSKLVMESAVPGFRPGKAPRRLIEKAFRKEVADRVKGEVLLASLEQLGEDHDVAPLAPPEIDPKKIDVPETGDLTYEFEVEVRPTFDLPAYKGLKLKRPTKAFTEADVAESRRRVLRQESQIVPKDDQTAELGDIVVADIEVKDGDRLIGKMGEMSVDVERQLAFKDGIVRKFAEQIKGVKPGESRTLDVELSSAAADLAGKTVKATFAVKDVKTRRLPELTEEYLSQFGLATSEQLDESIRGMLEKQLEHQQRRSARLQVLQQINAASTWDLPQELLKRQARRALNRRLMEMKADGMSEADIAKELRLMQQDILETTAMTLKEHFVLQKIAETEKIDVDQDDIDDEIDRIAEEADESPRKVRARLEKDDMMESLMAEMVERRALDLILDTAEYEDVPLEGEEPTAAQTASVESQVVPGEMQDPTAAAPETPVDADAQEGK